MNILEQELSLSLPLPTVYMGFLQAYVGMGVFGCEHVCMCVRACV